MLGRSTRTCVWISSIEVPRTVFSVSGCISLLLRSLPKLPSQYCSSGLGKFGNLGSNKEIYSLNSDSCLHLFAQHIKFHL